MKQIMNLFLLTCFWLGGLSQVYAQAETIKGVVRSSEGESLPGVNVFVKGTSSGTTTDAEGAFSFTHEVQNGDTLLASFMGYKTFRTSINSQREFNITLEPRRQMLEEMVVVGYGREKKADLTGSVSSLSMEDITKIPTATLDESLQGLSSGVRVTQNTGAPGEGVSVRVRGVGSINSSNDPLFIVDGVPTKDAMNNIAPSDIESVNVLKDASSTAIYGSRANNGVVLITTKQGKKGKTTFNFRSLTGLQKVGSITSMTNKDEYVEVYNEAAENDNQFVENEILLRPLISDSFSATLPDIDHLDAIFRNALQQQYSLSANGGNETMQYHISGNYYDQEGILLNSDYERLSGKVSISAQPGDLLSMGTNLNVSTSARNIVGSSGDGYGGNGGSAVRYALFRTPAIPIYDEKGNYVDLPDDPEMFGDGYNPVGHLENTHNVRDVNRIFGDVFATLGFTDNLELTSRLGLDYSSVNQRRFDKNWGTNNRINNPNVLTAADEQFSSWTWNSVLTYSPEIHESHNLKLTAGTEAIHEEGYSNSTSERDFADQTMDVVYLGNGQGTISADESVWASSLLSFFARANYNYMNKYLLSATVRHDGSSRLASNNRWGTFYSASAGWRIDRESFMENVDFISQWKLRGGVGFIGNQDIGYYAYSDQITPGYNYPFGGISQNGYAMSVFGNQSVKWETSNQYDFGMDIELLKGKIDFSVNYYQKYTKDMLTKESIPPSGGYADPAWINSGKVLNTGLELEGAYKQKSENFAYRLSGNFSTLHNEVLDLKSSISGGRIDNGVYATKTEEGYPIGSFFLYEMEGIFQNEADIITHAYQGDNIQPGDVKFKDQNGDGVIDADDRTHVGSSIPDFTGGLAFEAEYRNVDFSFFLQGAYGQEIYYQVATDIEGFYRPFNLTQRYYDERWTGEGTSNTQPRPSWKAKSNNAKPSTRFLEDGSYLRLKSLQIGYSFPKHWLKKMALNQLRFYVSGLNLYTWTAYPGLDPEMTVSDNSKSEGDRAANIDWGTYPRSVSYNFGVQLGF
ncbi:MAG: SusC/RagA family TonB-linked outer membrane protein [Bacteroidota bacterium]